MQRTTRHIARLKTPANGVMPDLHDSPFRMAAAVHGPTWLSLPDKVVDVLQAGNTN